MTPSPRNWNNYGTIDENERTGKCVHRCVCWEGAGRGGGRSSFSNEKINRIVVRRGKIIYK